MKIKNILFNSAILAVLPLVTLSSFAAEDVIGAGSKEADVAKVFHAPVTIDSISITNAMNAGYRHFLINTDMEADDGTAIALIATQLTLKLNNIAIKLKEMSEGFVVDPAELSLTFIAGGANAYIQVKRVEALITAIRNDGLLRGVKTDVILGFSDVSKVYEEQGFDLLTDPADQAFVAAEKDKMARFMSLNKDLKNISPEFSAYLSADIDKIQKLFANSPMIFIINLKRPEEIIRVPGVLENLGNCIITSYAGAFNIDVPDILKAQGKVAETQYRQDLERFLNAGRANAAANNFTLVTQRSDGKRDIDPKNTPEFYNHIKFLEKKSNTMGAVVKMTANWNTTSAWGFFKKAAQKAKGIKSVTDKATGITTQQLLPAEDPHHQGLREVQGLFTELDTQAKVTGDVYTQKVRLLKDPEIRNRAKAAFSKLNTADDEIGYRKTALLGILDYPDYQMVIADPLTVMLACNPAFAATANVGQAKLSKFLAATPGAGKFVDYTTLRQKTGPDGNPIETGIAAFDREIVAQLCKPLEVFLGLQYQADEHKAG